jgi:hypothetical protein
MLLKKLSKARTGVLISERAESIGRIEVCRFIIRSSKLPFFLTKPFMQREQENGLSNKDAGKNLLRSDASLCTVTRLPYCADWELCFYVYFHPLSVVSTIRILADRIRLSADAISALADSLILLTHSLISLPFERAKRIEHLISHWIFFYSRRRKVRILLTRTKPSFRLFCILSLTSTNCLCVSHPSCCAPPLFRVAYFSLCQPNRNKEKPLYLQSSLISIQFTIYEAFVYTGPYGIGEFVRKPCSGTSSNHVDAYGVHSNG